ncbi:MAG: response regulator [Sulfuricurvum sp.]|uniref:response regulator n=1 Tax=Sulfuricurvum sp. TaxID=2025608 RepID=UPI0025F42084|nr:response regulator [Sulfuricurvum sp.]MCK9373329.1 response regulator [Sulfuricurvum sp.]
MSTNKKHHTIAILDTDRELSTQLCAHLCSLGSTVFQIFEPDKLSAIQEYRPDFIIIDPISTGLDDAALCEYLTAPESAGVVVFTFDNDLQQRSRLFECGILDYFQKKEPLAYVANQLSRLFETINTNPQYQVTVVSDTRFSEQKFNTILLHRKYHLTHFSHPDTIKEQWAAPGHLFPDLLILDLKEENTAPLFEFIDYVRIDKISEIPIIVLSGSLDPDLSARLYRAGVNTVLTQIYSAEEFLWTLAHTLDYRISKKWFHYEHTISSQLKAMIDSSSIVSKADPKGIITYVNERFCTISGYTKEELIGRPHSIIRHPDTDPMIFRQMWETIQNKQIFNGMIMNRRKDGSTYYIDSTIAPVLDNNNTIIEFISIRHDITPLIEKQHEIEEQRRQIQNVLDAQTSLVCMVDKMKGVVQSNRGFMEFLGIPSLDPEHCGFQNLYDLFLDGDDTLQISYASRYVWLEHLYEMRNNFIKVAMRDHAYHHHIFSIHVEKIPDYRFSGGICYLVSFENVSELNRALQTAKEASEAESRFLATISHEIRTPLNGIFGFTELLHETSLNEEQKKYLQAISYSSDTLRQIINDILHVMKLEREQLELYNETIHLIRELEAIFYPFYALAAKKRVDMLVLIDPRLPVTVETDILHLKQILTNLISNAIKFTPSDKRIYIRVKKLQRSDGKVKIGFTVADEGIGVKPEHKERIFKAFIQADNSIAREYGGTGLGLNIAIRVTAAMGGKIAFKSQVGKGSVFHTVLELTDLTPDRSYEYQKKDIRLYCPASDLPPRFKLVEQYLKRFGCTASVISHLDPIDHAEDQSALSILLFMDCMKMSETTAMLERYQHANLYLISSFMPVVTSLPLSKRNIIWITNELTWSNITRQFDLYGVESYAPAIYEESSHFGELHILIAEDNEVNRFYIQEVLKKMGFTIDIAQDGNEALTKFMHHTYDLILMDVNMPNLDGISATRQILHYEQEAGRPHTPIIGVSADAIEKNIKDYIRQGLDGYLIKPLRKTDLIKIFHDFFGAQTIPPLTLRSGSDAIDALEITDMSLMTSTAQKLELPEEIVAELFRKFINNTQTLLQQIREHPNDSVPLKMAIHSLKGIARNLYMEPLGKYCHEFESKIGTLSENQTIQELETIIRESENAIHRMQKELIR